MVIAVGSGNEIGMILPELGALSRHPVMTVQKVYVCKRDGQLVSRPRVSPAGEPAGETARLKLPVYTSEAARHDGQPVHRAIAARLGPAAATAASGISQVTTLRGIWGFHADHAPHGDHFPHLGRHGPVITTALGTPERIRAAFDDIDTLTGRHGLVTAETVLAVHPAAHDAPCPS